MAHNDIEIELRNQDTLEIPSKVIGKSVMKKLKKIDKVAYIRFASIYCEFRDVDDFEKDDANINGKKYIVIDIVKYTKYQDVVELACEKYYNSYEIENGEFVKVFRKMVEEYWPQVDTSKFLEESLLKNYISIIIS